MLSEHLGALGIRRHVAPSNRTLMAAAESTPTEEGGVYREPHISTITTISARQRGPRAAKLFIPLRGRQRRAWFLPFVSNAQEQPGGENDARARRRRRRSPWRGWAGARIWRKGGWHPGAPCTTCIHIRLHQWAIGKCKPKVIAPDKNICSVNKYSNEASGQVPHADARLTGLRRDRR